jgi:hypothetical protein
MSEKCLHRAQRRPRRIKQRRVCMPQGMPTDSFEAELPTGSHELSVRKVTTAEGCSFVSGEDQCVTIGCFGLRLVALVFWFERRWIVVMLDVFF